MTTRNFYTPLLVPLAGLITGIFVQNMHTFSFVFLLCVFAIIFCWTIITLLFKDTKSIKRALFFLLGILGALVLQINKTEYQTISTLLSGTTVDIVATVTDKDQWAQGEVLTLNVQELFFKSQQQSYWLPCNIMCYFTGKAYVQVGDKVKFKHIKIPVKKSVQARDGKPSYDDYLAKQHVACSLFLTNNQQCSLLSRPVLSFARWKYNLRHRIFSTIQSKLSPRACSYFGLIFLGKKPAESITALRTKFNYWGLAHYLARSGLHIVLFIVIWTFFLTLVPMHIRFKNIILLVICLLYDILSWTSISFARAFYVFLFMKTGSLCSQQSNFLHLLTLVCFSILLFNPLQLFFLDFQLSFLLTFTLSFL